MKEGFIFWKEPVRLVGAVAPDAVASRLASSLGKGPFRGGNRLVGTVHDYRFRVWQKNLLSPDSVECVGVIGPGTEGSIIEGTLQYKLATRIQFAGGLLLGVILAGTGLMQKLTGPESPFAAVGFIILGVMLVWIYSSARMKSEQIRFIREKLEEIVCG